MCIRDSAYAVYLGDYVAHLDALGLGVGAGGDGADVQALRNLNVAGRAVGYLAHRDAHGRAARDHALGYELVHDGLDGRCV